MVRQTGLPFVRKEPFRMGGTNCGPLDRLQGDPTATRSQGTADRQMQRCFAKFDGKGGSPLLGELADDSAAKAEENWPGLIDGTGPFRRPGPAGSTGTDGASGRSCPIPGGSSAAVRNLIRKSIRCRFRFLWALENLLSGAAGHPLPGRLPHPSQPGAHFSGPLTISYIRHSPQSLSGQIGIFSETLWRISAPG